MVFLGFWAPRFAGGKPTPQAALRDARLEKEAAEARIRELELAAKEARKIHEKRLNNVCHFQ